MLEWGAAERPAVGQTHSGDRWLVRELPGAAVVAVVDGLGHGEEAAAAAELAVRELERHPPGDVAGLVQHCHWRLRSSRGAVMTVCFLDLSSGAMTWIAVGNVFGVLLRRPGPGALTVPHYVVSRGGVLGRNLPALWPQKAALGREDLLVLATDGVRPDFVESVLPLRPPAETATRILQEHATAADDALVLAVRCRGG